MDFFAYKEFLKIQKKANKETFILHLFLLLFAV